MIQYITRSHRMDAGHRVKNEKMKCFNFHSHSFKIDLTYSFEQIQEIGYAVDFKEIKRTHCQFIDDFMDHGFIANPEDNGIINLCKEEGSKLWIMSLNGDSYCNPSAENLGKELFLAIDYLTKKSYPLLTLHKIILYETPNCSVTTYSNSISELEQSNFLAYRQIQLDMYAEKMGVLEYDDRKVNQ